MSDITQYTRTAPFFFNEVRLNEQLEDDATTMLVNKEILRERVKLYYDVETVAFTGTTLTGGTSGNTGTIVEIHDDGSTGWLLLEGVTGNFTDNEIITDNLGGSATANGITKNFPVYIMVRSSEGNEIMYLAEGATTDWLNFTITTRDVLPYGTDPLESGGNALTHQQGSSVVNSWSPQEFEGIQQYIQGLIASGGRGLILGDYTNNSITIDRVTAAGIKKWLKYDYSTSKSQFSDNGTSYNDLSTVGAHGTAASLKDHVDVAAAVTDSPVTGDLLRYDGADWNKATVSAAIGANIQNQSTVSAASSAGTDTYAITLSPAPAAYATHQKFTFKADVANTGAATLNVNALGAKTIKKFNDQDLETGDIEAGQEVVCVYDGTNMQMVSQIASQMSTASKTALTGGAASNADGEHTHTKFSNNKSGVTTYELNTASGTQTIAHGLGATPGRVKITALFGSSNGTTDESVGWFDGTNNKCIYVINNSTQDSGNSTSAGVFIQTGAGASQSGVISVNGTNITITWTKTGSPTGTLQILWEAYGA